MSERKEKHLLRDEILRVLVLMNKDRASIEKLVGGELQNSLVSVKARMFGPYYKIHLTKDFMETEIYVDMFHKCLSRKSIEEHEKAIVALTEERERVLSYYSDIRTMVTLYAG